MHAFEVVVLSLLPGTGKKVLDGIDTRLIMATISRKSGNLAAVTIRIESHHRCKCFVISANRRFVVVRVVLPGEFAIATD